MPYAAPLAAAALLAAAPSGLGGQALTSASLDASIASSHVVIAPAASFVVGNNLIGGEAFKGAFGIVAVTQSSGANAIVQQAVTIKTGDIIR